MSPPGRSPPSSILGSRGSEREKERVRWWLRHTLIDRAASFDAVQALNDEGWCVAIVTKARRCRGGTWMFLAFAAFLRSAWLHRNRRWSELAYEPTLIAESIPDAVSFAAVQ
jgi:hypothetical protein